MEFTYDAYRALLNRLKEQGYANADYDNWQQFEQCAILRHDIDNDLQRAVRFARLEQECGVRSTYFVLVTSDFYNVFSARSRAALEEIAACGHEIGLHFDEVGYPEISGDTAKVTEKILWEAKLLGDAVGRTITKVSMHRPSKQTLEADLEIPGMVNSYGQVFFHDFKYVSDSRRRWREPVEEYVEGKKFPRLHILTHAFWYGEQEQEMAETVKAFLQGASLRAWDYMQENFTDLESVVGKEEL